MKELYNLFLFLVIIGVVFYLFRSFNYREGMTTDASGNSTSTPLNGIAGNAASYAAALKASTIKMQDTFLISKYRSDYESAILNLDDYINNLMLNIVLTMDMNDPVGYINQLANMQQAKTALNSVMKFVDSQ